MQDKLIELSQRFENENNVLGKQMAMALHQYLEDFKEELNSNIYTESDVSKQKIGEIVNCLADKTDRKNYLLKNMYPVLEEKEAYLIECEKNDLGVIECLNQKLKEYKDEPGSLSRVTAGYMFFHDTFSGFKRIVDEKVPYQAILREKDGREYKVTYYLCFSPLIVNKIRKMWNLSKAYGDESPIAYAPYASRFIRIDIDISSLPVSEGITVNEFDFCFGEAALRDKVLVGKELIWNVKCEKGGFEVIPSQSPVGDIVYIKYRFAGIRSNQYIIPDKNTWPTFEVRKGQNGDIELIFENHMMDEFYKITIYDIDDNDMEETQSFKPDYNVAKLRVQARLRSAADIRYELEKYSKHQNVRASDITMQKSEVNKKANKYMSEFNIYEKGRFGYKNTNKVFVHFTGNSEYIFFEDYINFVIDHLTYLYPEIGWEGVY